MATRLRRACLPNPSCAVPFTFTKTVRRGRLQRPRCLRFLLPNLPTTTFGISASLLVSEFGPWLRGFLFLRRLPGLPESLEPRTRPARQRDPVPTRPAQGSARPTRDPPGSAKAGERGWTGGHGVGRAADRPAGIRLGSPANPALPSGSDAASRPPRVTLICPGLQLTSPIFLFSSLGEGAGLPVPQPSDYRQEAPD